ncbi:MAG: anthranilate synthase component I family protein, partial [Terrimonas sp.]|nr:anthranilate synthase component I family protein [Terrimonas sp.]
MKKIAIRTNCRKMLSDVHTPVGIYLRVRDRFRDTVLLESTDYHAAENSYSFIGINAIAGMEITNTSSVEFKLPNQKPEKLSIANASEVPGILWGFMQRFEVEPSKEKIAALVQGLYGYTTFDAVQFFDSIKFNEKKKFETGGAADDKGIPLMRYRL